MHSMFSLYSLFLAPLIRGSAYLDPGSGSFILQILLATLLGAAFVMKSYWRRILGFFRGKSQDETDDIE